MALENNDLYSEATQSPEPRIQPAEGPGAVVTRQFAQGTGTLPAGTPLSVNSSGFLVKLAPAGTPHATAPLAEVVVAIVWPKAVTLNASAEVQASVMQRGQAHLDDVATAHGTAATNANFLLALRNPKTRYGGIHIDGLTIAQ